MPGQVVSDPVGRSGAGRIAVPVAHAHLAVRVAHEYERASVAYAVRVTHEPASVAYAEPDPYPYRF